jgi:limonene-1,2-epoxide hydrolase
MTSFQLSDEDVALRAAFESGALPPADFTHRAHVALAYVYLAPGDVEGAIEDMRRGLAAYLRHHGIDPAKYHETLTRAWVLAVWHFMSRSGPLGSSADLIARNPVLLDSRIMLTHYSAARLFSDEARSNFVEPDLDPIPRHAGTGPGDPSQARETAMKPRELVEHWVEAFNRADADALAGFYAEYAVNHQVAESPVEGRAAIREMFARGFASATMVCIVENLFEDGEWAILEWRDPLGLRGCGFFRVVGGRIVFQRGYWDKLSFLRQQGLPLPRE